MLEYRKDRGYFASLLYFDHIPTCHRQVPRFDIGETHESGADYPVAGRDTYDGGASVAVWVVGEEVTIVDENGDYVKGVEGRVDEHDIDVHLVAVRIVAGARERLELPHESVNLSVFAKHGWRIESLDGERWRKLIQDVYAKRDMLAPEISGLDLFVDATISRFFVAQGPREDYRVCFDGPVRLGRVPYLRDGASIHDADFEVSSKVEFRPNAQGKLVTSVKAGDAPLQTDGAYLVDSTEEPARRLPKARPKDSPNASGRQEFEPPRHLVIAQASVRNARSKGGTPRHVALVVDGSIDVSAYRFGEVLPFGLEDGDVELEVRWIGLGACERKPLNASDFVYRGPRTPKKKSSAEALEGAFRQLDRWRRQAEPSCGKRWGLDKKPDGPYLRGGPFRDLSGMQFYFDYDFKFWKGHSFHPNSQYGVSSIAQHQFWRIRRPNGAYRSMLSVDLGDLYTGDRAPLGIRDSGPRFPHPESIWRLTRDEMQRNVWQQLMAGFDLTLGVHVPRPSYFHIDDNLEYGVPRDLDSSVRGRLKRGFATDQLPIRNNYPFLINRPGEWALRPLAEVWTRHGRSAAGLEHEVDPPPALRDTLAWYPVDHQRWIVAGPHMRTYTRMTTMEAANESARHAVNRILYHMGIELRGDRETRERLGFGTAGVLMGDFCELWDPEDNEVQDLAYLKRIDEELVKAGLPHFVDILGLEKQVEAGLSLMDAMSSAVGAARRFADAKASPLAAQIPGLAAKSMEQDWGSETFNWMRAMGGPGGGADASGGGTPNPASFVQSLFGKDSKLAGSATQFGELARLFGGAAVTELLKAMGWKPPS